MEKDSLPLHFLGGDVSPIALHRTGYGKNDLFLGIKAGKANVSHGHMDAGSFVIDWAGHRWAADLGMQSYGSLENKGFDLWMMSQDSGRWTVFRLNNFSHNTLTYNGQLHRVDGESKIISSEGAPKSETTLSMAAALGLPEGATAKRHFKMEENPVTVTVTDLLTGLHPGDVITWHMITPAKVSRKNSGLELEIDEKRLSMKMSSPQTKSAGIAPADPPTSDFDQSNPGMTRIKLNAEAGQNGKVAIRAIFQEIP
jgi:hypothetical protein